MASPSASSVPTYLAIAAGNTVTTWDCNQEEPTRFSFQPHGDIDVGDIAWNHNGQGVSFIIYLFAHVVPLYIVVVVVVVYWSCG